MPPKSKATDVEPAEATRIADLGLSFDPDPHFARGDARDIMLDMIRTSVDWSKIDEQRQRDINAAVDQAAETIVAKLVKAIAAEGRDTVNAKVEQLTVKDGLKLQLTAIHDHDSVVLLGDLVGKRVTLTRADTGDHDHARGPARVDADQPDMLAGQPDDLTNAGDGPTATGVPDGQRVNLKTGMIERALEGGENGDWEDVREATPEELAAAREQRADDFDDSDADELQEQPA